VQSSNNILFKKDCSFCGVRKTKLRNINAGLRRTVSKISHIKYLLMNPEIYSEDTWEITNPRFSFFIEIFNFSSTGWFYTFDILRGFVSDWKIYAGIIFIRVGQIQRILNCSLSLKFEKKQSHKRSHSYVCDIIYEQPLILLNLHRFISYRKC
jgi:hypothetical protein